jgi:hypothetical protein
MRRDPSVTLPFPFCFLGTQTLMEYKSPDDRAGQEDLATPEIYGMLYVLRNNIAQRRELTLWLAASHFASDVSLEGGAYLSGAQDVGAGGRGGTLDGFPTFFIDLTRLPVAPEALPLLMVAKGPQERQMVEFLIDHSREYPMHLQLLRELHIQKLEEVLNMRQLTPEQIGIDYEALLRLLGEERAIKLLEPIPKICGMGCPSGRKRSSTSASLCRQRERLVFGIGS